MKHFKSIPFNRLAMILVGGLVAFSLAFTFPSGTALAVAPTPSPKTRDYSALNQAFQREQSLLTIQQANIGNAGGAATKVQDLISKAQAKGLDTSALATGLATFQSQLATAQASHATAEGILSAHNTLVQATADLMKAVEQWRDQNHLPTPTPSSSGF